MLTRFLRQQQEDNKGEQSRLFCSPFFPVFSFLLYSVLFCSDIEIVNVEVGMTLVDAVSTSFIHFAARAKRKKILSFAHGNAEEKNTGMRPGDIHINILAAFFKPACILIFSVAFLILKRLDFCLGLKKSFKP
jgi:hypothetical protein